MLDVMLFGSGWHGFVWKMEVLCGFLELHYFPEMIPIFPLIDIPEFKAARFKIIRHCISGHIYLIGFSDKKPTDEEIQWVYGHNEMKPAPIE